ncbi:lysosome-associated membrane glycoprotein 3 [Arapaima gigas]
MFLCILLLLGSRRAVLVALAETRSEVSVAATNGTYHEVTYTQMPTLVPKESVPQIGSYSLLDSNGRICLKASMAVEYVVTYGKKTLYYNIHPSSTNATGACRENTSNLLLSFSGGNIEFTFLKKGTISYVSEIRADLQATPDCKRLKDTVVYC